MSVEVVPLIERKKRGEAMQPEEIAALLQGYLAGEVHDYQMAAWLMAVCWRGMTEEETLATTRAMVASGEVLDWSGIGRPTVDKHSTGGVGDKTSIVLVPLMAAAGAAFVKMSGRGLGHTGGTLDKLEAIPGFRVEIDPAQMRAQVERIGAALVGQSPSLVPADGKLYALRDVTGTVDSMPLIASSIMSKKLAGGAAAVVLDVKWGSGAFMTTLQEARELAHTLVRIGNGAGRATRAVLSSMREPLGRAVGNALEVCEAIDTLRGEGPEDLWQLTLELGTHQLLMAGLATTAEEARERLSALRASGAGARKLEELIEAQHGDPRVVEDPTLLPKTAVVEELCAEQAGWVSAADARTIGEAALALGAGRRRKGDPVDPAVGIVMRVRIGDRVEEGAPLAEIHSRVGTLAADAAQRLREAILVSPEEVPAHDERYEVIGA